jgi:hypothetical protein
MVVDLKLYIKKFFCLSLKASLHIALLLLCEKKLRFFSQSKGGKKNKEK